jgi:hypothetical protein
MQAYQNFLNHPELGGYGQTVTTDQSTGYQEQPSSLQAALKRFNTAQRKAADLYA